MLNGKQYITRSKFDYFGKVLEIRYPNNQLVNYGYDSAGQLNKVGTSVNPEAYVKSISYTATGKRKEIEYGNGVTTSYQYDPVRDAIKQIKTTKASGVVLQDLTYSFDKVGNISTLVNGADLGTTSYGYDSLDRLTSSVASGFSNTAMNYSRTIGFADNGNIDNKSDVGSYSWSPSVNQLLTVGNRSMLWDGVGNLSSRTILTNSESHLQKFSYDVHNNLSFFSNAHEYDEGGKWVKYSYDYSGQRLRKWSYSGNETIYPNKFYSIKNSKWTNNHIYAGKERICTLVNGEPSFIHRDQINSGGLITTNASAGSATAVVADKIAFAPYGEILYQQNTNSTLEEGFTGQILDPETGLYYYNARYYDPKIGIFISADTIVPDPYSSQDFNRYMYVKGNPIKYSDPTGHSFVSFIEDISDAVTDFLNEHHISVDIQGSTSVQIDTGLGGSASASGYGGSQGENFEGGVGPTVQSDAVDTIFGDAEVFSSGGSKPPSGLLPSKEVSKLYERLFPNLIPGEWSIVGKWDEKYNCIALCLQTYKKEWPSFSGFYATKADLTSLVKRHGFIYSWDATSTLGVATIALFATKYRSLKDAAQHGALASILHPGWWYSKMGDGFVLMHRLTQLEGGRYGDVYGFYKKGL